MIIEQLGDSFTKWHMNHPDDKDGLPFKTHPVFHRFTSPDTGDFHDHPWSFQSVIVEGGYVEEVLRPNRKDRPIVRLTRRPGYVIRNDANHIHRISRLLAPTCVTFVLAGTDAGFPDVPERVWRYWRIVDGVLMYRPHNETEWKQS